MSSPRTLVWLCVFICTLFTGAFFVQYFPENYPEETLAIEKKVTVFLGQITLPIKLARLSMQEPDARIRMPVYGVPVSRVTDTWHLPRGADRLHEGQDIFAPKGTPIFSGTHGYIRRLGTNQLGGNIVFITGAGGRRYYYAHLDKSADGLYVGQYVTTDTVIGFVGNTGNAATTPSHLHFGMYQGREALNPLPLMVDR